MDSNRVVVESEPDPRKKRIVITLVIVAGVLLFLLPMIIGPVIALVIKPYQIPSGSMLPTIQVNDRVLVDRAVYRFSGIERGDLIVFRLDVLVSGAPYVKRVIGIPGDTVEISDGGVLVNGEELVFPGATSPTYKTSAETVPAGKLFVLGDNRNESADSHIWGFVSEDDVIGRVDLIYWPPGHMKWSDL
ncbi:MAG: signal peptidase I [Thermoleophilia bacterium]